MNLKWSKDSTSNIWNKGDTTAILSRLIDPNRARVGKHYWLPFVYRSSVCLCWVNGNRFWYGFCAQSLLDFAINMVNIFTRYPLLWLPRWQSDATGYFCYRGSDFSLHIVHITCTIQLSTSSTFPRWLLTWPPRRHHLHVWLLRPSR